ncbi:MAG: toprim domain-containing protein, partial [Caldilineaceae bacterium]
ALNSWDGLSNYLSSRNFATELQVEAGLLKVNEERHSTYDAFRNRIIIPIRDRQGRVIGFGGRVMDDSQPKYLNTSETPLFHKSSVVYGLDLAYKAIRKEEQVVIVEGYMDVIAAHQFGYANVVACMGTALTPEQLQQLQRYTDSFILALDADAAGQQATMRGLNQARQSLTRVSKPTITPGGRIRLEEKLGANLRIAAVPIGKDPDDLIRRDAALWQKVVEDAKPLVDFYFDVVATQLDLTSARGKGLAVVELAPLIAELSDTIERQHYIQQLSRLVQVDERTITNRVSAAGRTAQAMQRGQINRPSPDVRPGRPLSFSSSPPPPSLSAGLPPDMDLAELGDLVPPPWVDEPPPDGETWLDLPPRPGQQRAGGATRPPAPRPGQGKQRAPGPTWQRPLLTSRHHENYLLSILLLEPELLIRLAGFTAEKEMMPLRVEDWQDAENQAIFLGLKQFIVGDEPWDLELFQEMLTSHLHDRLARLVSAGAQLSDRNLVTLEEAAVKAVLRMRLDRLKAELDAITFMLNDVQQNGDRAATLEYSLSINRHRSERYHLERVLSDLSKLSLA